MADGMKIHFDQCIVWRLGFWERQRDRRQTAIVDREAGSSQQSAVMDSGTGFCFYDLLCPECLNPF